MGSWMETKSALLAVLKALADEYPPDHKFRASDRDLMNEYIGRQDYHSARMCAIWSGVPQDRIIAVEALLL